MKFFDLTLQYKSTQKEIGRAIKRVLSDGNFIGGKEIESFEREFAKFCNVKYAIGVNSGTDALILSLKALKIGKDDEVITSPFTFVATASAIASAGAKPVFADIERDTFNVSPGLVEGLITLRTKAIIPVHLFGQMAEMKRIMGVAKKYKLWVVEDAAQAVGAGRLLGDTACFSFFPTKNLGAYGDGGMVTTNDKKLADKIQLLKNHGSSPREKYKNMIIGINSRLDALQAAILRVKLKHLVKWNKKRREIAEYYNQGLKGVGNVLTPVVAPNKTHVFHQYTIRLSSWKARDKLQKYLKKQGVPTMIYYPLPLHLQPAFKYLGYKKGDFPEAEKAAKEVLSLPIYPELTKKNQDYIISIIKEFYAK